MLKTFQLETVTCPSCIAKIENMLKKTNGVNKAEVLFNSSRVKVDFDDNVINADEIKNKINALGYKVIA
ncbi:TPA: heavy-metal-associated domain-containing protein [bacterium]|jgi:copper chaperone CopZ|nr:heavy-metal-associated domain-containing protein [bacterium]